MSSQPHLDGVLAGVAKEDVFLLELVALTYEPTDVYRLTHVLEQTLERYADVDGSALRRRLDRLERRGLCVKQRYNHYVCAETYREAIARQATRREYLAELGEVARAYIEWERRYAWGRSPWHFAALRLAFLQDDRQELRRCLEICLQYRVPGEKHPLARLAEPLDLRWLRERDPETASAVLQFAVGEKASRLEPLPTDGFDAPELSDGLALVRLLSGNLRGHSLPTDKAAAAFLRGDDATAAKVFDEDLKDLRRDFGRVFHTGFFGIWHLLARLSSNKKGILRRVAPDARLGLKYDPEATHTAFHGLLAAALLRTNGIEQAQVPLAEGIVLALRRRAPSPYDAYLGLAACWVDTEQARRLTPRLEELVPRAEDAGQIVTAVVACEVLDALGLEGYGARAKAHRSRTGLRTFMDLGSVVPRWQRVLESLAELGGEEIVEGSDRRLAWVVFADDDGVTFDPYEQKRKKRGGWTNGRPVSLQKLMELEGDFDYLSEQDHRMRGHIVRREVYHRYHRRAEFAIDDEAMAVEAIGHPFLLARTTNGPRVHIVRRELELEAQRTPDGQYVIGFAEPLPHYALVEVESPTRVVVSPVTEVHRRVEALVGQALTVPAAGLHSLQQTLGKLASVLTVRSEAGAALVEADEVEADLRIRARIWPAGDGFRLELRTKPFGDGGPVYVPGEGGEEVVTTVDGVAKKTTRDLRAEEQRAWLVTNACPDLDSGAVGFSWGLSGPLECLSVLSTLQSLSERVVIEWPEGERLKPPREISLQSLRATVRSSSDWFEVGAEVEVDAGHVLTLDDLLKLLEQRDKRFVELDSGDFIALTSALRRHLEVLARVTEPAGASRRFGPAAAPLVDDLLEDVGTVRRGRKFPALVRRLKEAWSLNTDPPSTFQATLRPYQLAGFRWMAGLAEVGLGALLADDMGLGKTVQALAMLVRRGSSGPALVVAPTSVCPGWVSEATRFAPTLRPKRLGTSGRQELVEALGPFDVLVASYAILHRERELLSGVSWSTVVLDEAQAIKNPQARRTRAAYDLQAGFRIVTTGTPVENHLGELWSIMRFVNPGLLGSRTRFDTRFTEPISRSLDSGPRRDLSRLIHPFVLRRTKSEVLEELPQKTETTIRVELSAEERALYEALRRRAIESIATGEESARFRVLAELTRLRQACCHPRLVAPDTKLESSKLEAFLELLEELVGGGHKALVFSQFVKVLDFVREALDQRGFSYQYLDGSTPANARQERIAAFQRGEGDCFVISLRAGGTGLNLTAADYVIHLDPWWNPAVEDQASDRAHRIGQTRPVNVYRFVAEDTVEDRIVALHHQKRELAERVLEGTASVEKPDLEALIALLGAEGS